jgi:hypothetical protein
MRRFAMRGIKSFGVGLKCAETGFGAKVNFPSAIFSARKILGIGVVKDSSAKSHEVRRTNLNKFGFIHNALVRNKVIRFFIYYFSSLTHVPSSLFS